tara:strand:- start:288 stop:440 length:153 start_codon:yes stop_codon:yes gene_type:complete
MSEVRICYMEDCKENRYQKCKIKTGQIIIKKDNSCAYYMTEEEWLTLMRR